MSIDSARTTALGTAALLMAGISALLLFPPGIEHDLEPGLEGPGVERPGPGGPGYAPLRTSDAPLDIATAESEDDAAAARADDGAEDHEALRDAPAQDAGQSRTRGKPLNPRDGLGASHATRYFLPRNAAARASKADDDASTASRPSRPLGRAAQSSPRDPLPLASLRRARASEGPRQRRSPAARPERSGRRDAAFARTAWSRHGRPLAGDMGGGYGRAGRSRAGRGRAASLFDPAGSEVRERKDPREGRRSRRDFSPRRFPHRFARRGRGGRSGRARASTRRFKPLLLGSALGPKTLRPPDGKLEPPPALLALPDRRPENDFAGRPTPSAFADLSAAEDLNPAALARDRHAGPHWDKNQWHDGPARGLEQGGSWLWTYRDGARLWALAGRPAEPLLRRGSVWWMKHEGMWFVVHDGEPWALRNFADWGAQGLFQPATGTQIVYSSDYSRAAVITPGNGAEVFDARTGALIGSIPEDRMPAPRRPKMPESLPTPQ